jgi:hypothetical protein
LPQDTLGAARYRQVLRRAGDPLQRVAEGVIYLLLIYAKGVRDDVDAKTLDKVRKTIHGKDKDD